MTRGTAIGRRLLRLAPLAIAGLLVLPGVAAPQRSKRELPNTVAVVDSEMFERSGDLNTVIETAGGTFDRVDFEFPKRALGSIEVLRGPQGWICKPEGGRFSCRGDGTNRGYFRFRPTASVNWGRKVDLGIYSGDQRIGQEKLEVGSRSGSVSDQWTGKIDAPRRFAPGETIWAQPLGDGRSGSWSLQVDQQQIRALPVTHRSFQDLTNLQPALRDEWDRSPDDVPLGIRLSGDLRADSDLRWIHHDGFGYKDVDALFDGWQFEMAPQRDCQPTLGSCHEMVAMKGTLCVCGCFPTGFEWGGLLLDNKPIGGPSGSSSFSMRFPLGDDVGPGTHRLSWAPGSDGVGSLDFEVVRVGGSIDQAHLQVGQSTGLKFWIDGTPKVLPMDIELTKGNAEIQGGNQQRTWTDGGDPNQIDRMLHARGVGDFDVIFSLDLDDCSCEMSEMFREMEEMVEHRFEPVGNATGTLPGLGLTLPIRLSSRSLIAETPRPPLDRSRPIEFDVRQLGLRAETAGLPEMIFETRSELRSWGRLSDIELTDSGGFKAGYLDLELHTQFSIANPGDSPYTVLRPGGSFRVDLGEAGLSLGTDYGDSPYRMSPGSDSTGSIDFSKIELDAAGTRYFGDARIQLGNYRVEF